jgi:RNA ligase (TIGR02306 family)
LQKPGKLKEKHRVSAKRLRGVWSEGLLIPVDSEKFKEGDNAWTELELERFEPTLNSSKNKNDNFSQSRCVSPPDLPIPIKYDLENYKKYKNIFQAKTIKHFNPETNEFFYTIDEYYSPPNVIITEKIHGSFARFVFDEKMHYGSRNQWKAPEKNSLWFEAVAQNPWIEFWCKSNPKKFLMGEVFGHQNLTYGAASGQVLFRVFDVWDSEDKIFWNYEKVLHSLTLEQDMSNLSRERFVPILYEGIFSDEIVKKLTDGISLIEGSNHIREGVVIKTTNETVSHFGRHILKNISNDYYSK